MKITLFISILFLSLTSSSCSKDDNDHTPQEPTNEELIVGRWYVKSLSNATTGLSDCVKQSYFEFSEDNSLTALAFSLNGSDECIPADAANGDYNITSENELVLTTPEITQILKILVLTEEKLILSHVDSGSAETVITSLTK